PFLICFLMEKPLGPGYASETGETQPKKKEKKEKDDKFYTISALTNLDTSLPIQNISCLHIIAVHTVAYFALTLIYWVKVECLLHSHWTFEGLFYHALWHFSHLMVLSHIAYLMILSLALTYFNMMIAL
ncbi:hypothetical protein ACJX0J_038825, partial [Zea mays]